jgi:hypothetical protein
MWITIGDRAIGRLVVCDNLVFKELYKAEENNIFREENIIKQL